MGGGDIEEINEFIAKVKKEFKPEAIILFGSRARGEELKGSDYDLIVISEKFQGVPFLERLFKLYELWDLDRGADILAYTLKEFEEKKREIGIIQKAAEEGVVVG